MSDLFLVQGRDIGGCTQGCTYAPRYITDWLWNGWVMPHSLCSCNLRKCKGEGVVAWLWLKTSYSQLIYEHGDM